MKRIVTIFTIMIVSAALVFAQDAGTPSSLPTVDAAASPDSAAADTSAAASTASQDASAASQAASAASQDAAPETAATTAEAATPSAESAPSGETTEPEAAEEKPAEKKKSAFVRYWTDPQKTPTPHLKPYSVFRLGLVLAETSAGFATNSPLGVFTMKDWMDSSGKLILDFTRLANDPVQQKDGFDLNFMMDYKFMDLHIQGKKVKGYEGKKKKGESSSAYATRVMSDWGLGFDLLSINSRFDLVLTPDLVKFIGKGNAGDTTVDAGFEMSGAVFMESLGVEWHKENFFLRGLYVSLRPAHYIPVLYIPKSKVAAIVNTTGDTTAVDVVSKVQGYSSVWSEKGEGLYDAGGLDMTIAAEYAALPILDVGLTLANVPLLPAKVKNGLKWDMNSRLIDMSAIIKGDGMGEVDTETDYTKADKTIMRPLKMDVYALYRPLRTDFLVLKPNVGFTAITPAEETYFNVGLEASLNIGRWFTASFFTGMEDGLARNRIGLDFHWKVLPIFMYYDMRSQDYGRSWTGSGSSFTLGAALAF